MRKRRVGVTAKLGGPRPVAGMDGLQIEGEIAAPLIIQERQCAPAARGRNQSADGSMARWALESAKAGPKENGRRPPGERAETRHSLGDKDRHSRPPVKANPDGLTELGLDGAWPRTPRTTEKREWRGVLLPPVEKNTPA